MSGGDLVLMARRRAGLSQRQLAGRLGCRQATIARWERGDRAASYEDVEDAVAACGLQLDANLALQDRSWWPQIALQLDREPAERVRHLTPAGGFDALPVIRAVGQAHLPVVVIGKLACALHGSPLVLDGEVELCVMEGEGIAAALERLDARRHAGGAYDLAGGGRLVLNWVPPGTAGYGDLARGAESIEADEETVQVAGLVDLLRIADASSDPDARRQSLALRAVLDVRRAQCQPQPDAEGIAGEERIERWLSRQTPVA